MEDKIDALLEKFPNAQRESLIPILQEIQNEMGYLSEDSIIKVGKYLKLPSTKIYGVATFYNMFRFEQKGKFHIQICRGTACHVLGSATVLDFIERELKVKSGETSRNGMYSLEILPCLGACGQGPVIVINGEYYTKVTLEKLREILDTYKV